MRLVSLVWHLSALIKPIRAQKAISHAYAVELEELRATFALEYPPRVRKPHQLSNLQPHTIGSRKLIQVTRSQWWAGSGGVGGVLQGTFTKSKNSVISICAASRLVRLGRLNRVSTSFSHAV